MIDNHIFHYNASVDTSSHLVVKLWWLMIFWLGHVPLAIAMHRNPKIAMTHALLVLGIGLFCAFTTRGIERILWVAAYVTGSEVLWRMCKSGIPWETGKYAVSAILLVFGIRVIRQRQRWPLFYLLMLLPAAFVTLFELDFTLGRKFVSFNLSGPLSLAVCLWFLSFLALSTPQICRILAAMIAPIIGIAAITLFTTYTSTALQFTTSSNFATSGGFGPNQVSAILALGFMLTFFLIFFWPRKTPFFYILVIPLLPIFLMQSAMTFSRTGLYLACGSVLAASLFLFRSSRARAGLIFGSTALILVTTSIIIPRLDKFTDGMLNARFNEVSTTNRADIFMEEMAIWGDHVFFGVGAGMARYYREGFSEVASHTEVSRLFAEHGLLGLAALVMLIFFVLRNYLSKLYPTNKAFTAGLTIWFFGFLLVSGMRLVAPSFVLGMAFLVLNDKQIATEGKI